MKSDVVAMEEHSSTVEFHDRTNTSRKFKIMLIVVAVLAVLALTFIVLYAVEKTLTRVKTKTHKDETPCTTRECVGTAMGKFRQLNLSFPFCTFSYVWFIIEIRDIK